MTYCLFIQSENPTIFEEATQTKEWKQAIKEEVIALEKNVESSQVTQRKNSNRNKMGIRNKGKWT